MQRTNSWLVVNKLGKVLLILESNFAAAFPDVFKNQEGRIVNGFDTGQALPYQLQIVFVGLGPKQQHICGATLVTKKYATSAYHCFALLKYDRQGKKKPNTFYLNSLRVIAGLYTKMGFEPFSRKVQVSFKLFLVSLFPPKLEDVCVKEWQYLICSISVTV